jgi:hypothetical protein
VKLSVFKFECRSADLSVHMSQGGVYTALQLSIYPIGLSPLMM